MIVIELRSQNHKINGRKFARCYFCGLEIIQKDNGWIKVKEVKKKRKIDEKEERIEKESGKIGVVLNNPRTDRKNGFVDAKVLPPESKKSRYLLNIMKQCYGVKRPMFKKLTQ